MPSQLLSSIREAYPELGQLPDEDLIVGIGEQNKNIADAIRWEMNRDSQLQLGRERIAAETPLEFDIADQQAAGDGPLGRIEQALGPGGRAIARGAGQMVTSSLAAKDMIAAAPRVWLGRNPLTDTFERVMSPNIGEEILRGAARPVAERPSYGPQSLKEAWADGETLQFLTERGLEQVPQMVGSLAAGDVTALAGLAPKTAALAGIGLTTFPQESGGAYEEIKEQTGEESPGTAMLVGAINTALEAAGDAKMFERALGGDKIIADTVGKYARSALARAGGQMGKEATTESLQELSTAGVPYLTSQTEAPQNLGERMLEAGVSAMLPGGGMSATVDALGAARPGYLTPPKLKPGQVSFEAATLLRRKQDEERQALANAINDERQKVDEARRQARIDEQLAVQMGEAREEAARQRLLAEQNGTLAEQENQIAIAQALAESDAVIGAMLAKRQTQGIDIPELTPGIVVPTSPAMERIRAEQERRDSMTPEQRSALEMLERTPTVEGADPNVPFNRLRQAPTPDTLSGLDDAQPSTMAPSPVDFAIQEGAGRLFTDPAEQAAPPVAPRLAPGFTQEELESGLSTADQDVSGNPIVDFTRATQGPNEQLTQRPQGQLPQGPRRAAPVDTQSDLMTGVDPDGRTKVDDFIFSARASRARSKKSALRKAAARPARVQSAKERLVGARQNGRMGSISGRYAAALESLTDRLSEEETEKAVAGTSTTDDGIALNLFLNARRAVDSYLQDTGDQVNDSGRTYMERKFQENLLDVLSDPQRDKPVNRAFSGKTALRQALIGVRQNLTETGNSRGQTEEGVELEGESGSFENPAIARSSAALDQEIGASQEEPSTHNAQSLIADFVDRETGSLEEEQAAWNIIAQAFGQPAPFQSPDPARTLAEQSSALRGKVNAFIQDKVRTRIIRAHITGEPRVSIGLQAVQAAVRGLTSSDRVSVIYDPTMLHEGRPVSGFVDGDGNIVINAAFIDSPQMARDVLLEEMMHAVYGEADVVTAWDEVIAGVTQAEKQAMLDAGYTEDVAVEEAAVRKVIAQLNSREVEGSVARFIRSVVEAVKRIFGVKGQDPYTAILKRALKGGTPGGVRASIAGQDNPVAALDEQYMAAVEAGDMATAERLVGESARMAGYTVGPVYHGTASDFTSFRPSKTGNFGPGIYVSLDEESANGYASRLGGDKVIKGYAKVSRPIIGSDATQAAEKLFSMFDGSSDDDVIRKASEAGYDAVVAEGTLKTKFGDSPAQISLFSPSQIKSADPITRDSSGNVIPLSQRFNQASNDIRYSTVNPEYVIPLEEFEYRYEGDEYLYHVTTADRINKIIRSGSLVPGSPSTFKAGGPSSNSKGKTFLTERGGVKFWADRIAEQIEANVDLDEDQNADDLVRVIRVPKTQLNNLQEDTFADTVKGRDWYSTDSISLSEDGSDAGPTSGRSSIGGKKVRYSLSDGFWKTSAEVDKDLANAGDPQTIGESAALQAALIPASAEAAVNAIKARVASTKPKSKTASDRVALRILAPVMNMRELLHGALGSAGPSSWTVAAATGLASLVPHAKDIASEAILKTHLHLSRLATKTSEKMVPMIERVAEAFSKLPTASRLEMEGHLYMSMARQLARDFRKNIDDRIQDAKNSADESLARELALASRNLTESFKGSGSAISSALRNIAKEIPDTALVNAASTRTWIEQRVANKSLPPIMSQIASDWLFGAVPGRSLSPIAWDTRLNERLQVMKEIADEKSVLSADITAFDASITGTGKRPSTESVMMRYMKFREGHRDSMRKMRLIYREMEKAEAELEGSITAQGVLAGILSDPAYIQRVEDARDHLGALSRGVKLPNGYGDNTSPFGFDTYLHPVTGKKVVINQTPDPTTEVDNLAKLRALVADVQRWMSTTEDPLLKSAWDREIQFLVNRGFTPNPSIQTGQNLFGFRLPSWWQLPLNPLSRSLTQNRLDIANNIWNRVGNRMALRPLMAAQVTDRIRKAFEQLAGGNDSSEARIRLAVGKALDSHGRDRTDNSTVFQWWVPQIAERIISQHQNPIQVPYKAGDWINGVQITPEDMAAVAAMKKWQTEANGIVQKGGKLDFLGAYIDPIGTEEIVAGRSLVRRSVDYGLKMARTLSETGKIFTSLYSTADKAGKMDLLDQNYEQHVIGLIQETDSEVTGKLDDKDKPAFKLARELDRKNASPFTDLDTFLDWWADQVAFVTGRSTGEERIDAEDRLIGYFNGFTEAITRAEGQADKASVEDFEKKGIPVAIVKSVNGGANPFLSPRGKLIAPSSFYSYSMAGDGDRGRFKSAAITALTLKEVVAAKNALESIKKELEKYEGPGGLIAQEQAKAFRKSRFLAKRAASARSQERVRARKALVDYRSLVDHRQAVEVLIAGMERLALEHTVSKEDNAVTSFSNNLRSGFVSSVLASIKSMATNLAGGPIMAAKFRQMLGSYNFIIAPAQFLYEFSKASAGSITKKLRSIKTIDKTISGMARVPGFKQIIQAFIYNQTVYEQNRAKAVVAGLVDEPDWREAAAVRAQFKATAGHLSESNDPGMFIGAVNTFTSLPIIRQLVELSKSTFPGATDRLMNTALSALTERWLSDINSPVFEAWKRRDTGVVGWDEIGSPLNVFSTEELGLPDNNVLKAWRTIFSPAGGLENLSLDYYNQTKGMTPAQRRAEPMFTPEQLRGVRLEVAKLINLPTASTTPLVAQGKGLSGTIRRWTALFLRYPIAAQGFLENVSGTAAGDNPSTSWKYGSGILAIAIMLMIGAGASDFGQWMEEILYNNPRTKPSLAQTIQAGTAKDYAKYAGIAMTASYPFIAEQIGSALGGYSGKPLMDANRMIVPFGLANDAYQVVSRTLQTGDAFYPVTDFMRRYVPLAGAALNKVQPGEVQARAALRAARVAAPADLEIRQAGGSGQGSRETQMTPLIRRATNALLEGDEGSYQEAVQAATQYQVGTGKTPEAARRSVLASIASKDPARRVFGRPVTDEESSALLARMSTVSRKAYQGARSAFARFNTPQRSTKSSRARRTRALRSAARPARRSALSR